MLEPLSNNYTIFLFIIKEINIIKTYLRLSLVGLVLCATVITYFGPIYSNFPTYSAWGSETWRRISFAEIRSSNTGAIVSYLRHSIAIKSRDVSSSIILPNSHACCSKYLSLLFLNFLPDIYYGNINKKQELFIIKKYFID